VHTGIEGNVFNKVFLRELQNEWTDGRFLSSDAKLFQVSGTVISGNLLR
jgi:hypothetical protein